MKNSKLFVRIFAIVMAVLLITTAILPLFMTARAGRVEDLQDSISSLKQQQAEIQNKLNKVKADKNQQAQYLTEMQRQVANTNAQLQVMNQQIDQTNAEINDIKAQMDEINRKQEATVERFKQRVRSSYMGEDVSMMTMLASSGNFSDILISAEFMENASRHEDEMVSQLKAAMDELNVKRAQLDEKAEQLKIKMNEISQVKSGLVEQEREISAVKKSLEGNEAALKAENQRLLQIQWANQAEIEDIINSGSGNPDYVGGEFIWPVGGSTYISSGYGPRIIGGIKDYHTGIDITGGSIYGRDIRASNSGRVVYVRNYSGGYGLHLLIDHGGGKYTLYAHTSQILVSQGQWVTQGQTIAKVGSTGWSTGPHLHFEIWINNKHTNPINYLP